MKRALILLVFLALPSLSGAQTVYVTTGSTAVDIPSTALIPDLPGPDGVVSFEEARIVTENTPGIQTVGFHIPASMFNSLGQAYVLGVGYSYTFRDSVIIDGTTQTAFTGDTAVGRREVFITNTLRIAGPSSEVRGLDNTKIEITSSSVPIGLPPTAADMSLVEENTNCTLTVTTDDNVIQANTGGTLRLEGNRSSVFGNVFESVQVIGFGATVGNDHVIGGSLPGQRNVILGEESLDPQTGLPNGVALTVQGTKRLLVENNFIGTTSDGLSPGSSTCTTGILIESTNDGLTISDNLIGGVLANPSGGLLLGTAVRIQDTVNGLSFQNNTIGLDATGAATLPSLTGIEFAPGAILTNVAIGGYAPGEGNVIAGQILDGVAVHDGVLGARLAGNTMYGNGLAGLGFLAIDLLGDITQPSNGVTANDPLDTDTGGNGLQNYPDLSAAFLSTSGTLRVSGQLSSAPSTSYTLEFFGSSGCDPSGYGQAELPIGTALVTTDGTGVASFDVAVATVPLGWYVTATATEEPIGSTSEFSACVPVTDTVCAADQGFMGPGLATLSICGEPLSSGNSATMTVTGAAPNAPIWVSYGPFYNPTPIFGGTLVPVPGTTRLLGVTDANGGFTFAPVPGGGGPASVYVQSAFSDLGLPGRFGITNAVRVDILP